MKLIRVERRYLVSTTDDQKLSLPSGAAILGAGAHNGVACLWVAGDARPSDTKVLLVRMIRTGVEVDASRLEGLSLIGRAATGDGSLEWHVFAREDGDDE